MNNPDIAAVAAGLTKAEQMVVITRRCMYSDVVSPAMYPLWYAIQKDDLGNFCISLTPLGSNVRIFLTTDEQAMKEAEHGL